MHLLDRSGRALWTNRSAERTLRGGEGITTKRGEIRAEHSDEAEILRRAIAEVGRSRAAADQLLMLSRSSGGHGLSILLAPVPAHDGISSRHGSGPVVSERPAVVAYVGDADMRGRVPPVLLQRLYGLTPAEARVASLLAEGITLGKIAEELHLSRHTVRNELKTVFQKTGVNRQSELIRLLLSSAAVSATPDDADTS